MESLPEAVLQRIQSFLISHKEAARTSVLSKSWLGAWSTRPNIYLSDSLFSISDRDYISHLDLDPLPALATNTFRRYEESNLTIDSFDLCLSSDRHGNSGLAAEWTLKALQLGATRLTLRLDPYRYDETTIPIVEVFRSENLLSLRVEGLNMSRLDPHPVVKCSGLTSLTLRNLSIPDASFLYVIISCCPLIQNLSLSNIDWDDYEFDDDNHNRKRKRKAEQPQVHERSTMITLRELTTLLVCRVRSEMQAFLLDDLSSTFPNLKNLTLSFHSGKEMRIISSRSLEMLNFKVGTDIKEMSEVEFDVPSIRKFTFEGSCMPKLSFRSTLCDRFESHVSVERCGEPSTVWFCELSEFLSQLRGSKIYLYLSVYYKDSFNYEAGEIKGLEVCEVEDLTMATDALPSLSYDALLDGLFRICRPMMISQYASRVCSITDENTMNKYLSLCQALEQGMKLKSLLVPSQYMYGFRDLEEVNAQELLEGVWRLQPFDSVLDSLLKYDKSVIIRSEQRRRFRFQLKWNRDIGKS